ncbi:MAG: LysM peptidoglycan-binding domain-containing M23 family metallopeptidase [Candidatus Omnitrophota bacterium]
MSIKRYTYILVLFAIALTLIGCASVRPRLERPSARYPKGVYYEVKRGDTLWKISKLYDVSVNDIVRANRLPDATKISSGQKLFIPRSGGDSEELKYTRTSPGVWGETKFAWPVSGKVISCFGAKKGLITNKGIDIKASEGTGVIAADDGLVSFVDENMKGLGKTVIIDHGNGFSTVYAHNSEILVKAGDEVKKSTVIAKVGKTGRASEPYLHFQIRKGHEPQNPFNYLP